MRRSRGYSLLELVMVIVIAGTLAALAIPYFTDRESRATWYREQVKAGLRYAQRQAVAQRRSVCVEVQPSNVRVRYRTGVDCTAGALLTHITNGEDYVLAAPTGVAITPTVTFWFNGLGRPSTGAVLDVGGAAIVVHAETGYVE